MTEHPSSPKSVVGSQPSPSTNFSKNNVLFQYVLNVGCWPLVVSRAAMFPDEARYEDEYGRTALHLACMPAAEDYYAMGFMAGTGLSRPPSSPPQLQVIRALIQAYPQGVTKQNKWGCTPLHFASLYSHHTVVETLLQHSRNLQALRVANEDGHTPLNHMAMWYVFLLQRTQARFQAELKPLLTTMDHLTAHKIVRRNILATDPEVRRVWHNIVVLLQASHYGAITLPTLELDYATQDEPLHLDPCLRLQSSFEKRIFDFSTRKRNVLHACVSIDDCPPDVLNLALLFHQPELDQPNNQGNLPLHLALHNCTMGPPQRRRNLVKQILKAHPSAASVQNHHGELPIHLALKLGPCCGPELVTLLYQAFPGACTIPLPHPVRQTHQRRIFNNFNTPKMLQLFPFMMAAMNANLEIQYQSDALSTIYMLLRACPEMERFRFDYTT